MSITPQRAAQIANRLLGKKFAALAKPAAFRQVTGSDYDAQTVTYAYQTVPMIRLEYNSRQVDGTQVKTGDFQLIGERALFTWLPAPDNTDVTYDGEVFTVIRETRDPADATITVQARRK